MAGDLLELRLAWQRHVGTSATADRWFESVVDRHRQPFRHYHGVRHMVWMVRHLTAFDEAGHLRHPDAVVAAAFFHDVVYDATRSDNEAVSARLAREALSSIGWSDDRCDRVAAMVEATAGHEVAGADADTCALLAADLAVLAAPPARYDDYVRMIRREYTHVSDDDWRVGRGAVLRNFLERDHLFAPTLGLDEWEQRARANITAELATLDA